MSAGERDAPRALLLDLDDTLYDYVPAERRARTATLAMVARDTGLSLGEVEQRYKASRERVKARVPHTGSSHSRLLYLLDLANGVPGALAHVRAWEETFWRAYLDGAELRPYARELLVGWRALGHKVAIVTDLVVAPQLAKLEKLGLFPLIDALVVSEEVLRDKPALMAFELALERLAIPRERCVVIGDSVKKDGGGALALGVPYLRVRGTEPGEEGGMTLIEVARELGVTL